MSVLIDILGYYFLISCIVLFLMGLLEGIFNKTMVKGWIGYVMFIFMLSVVIFQWGLGIGRFFRQK